MNLPPHIQDILARLRGRDDVPESLFELFEGLKSIDPSAPTTERRDRWEAAIEELRRYWR
ncbi:MAG: hypothetical protein JO001_19150 [Alphaproteobacteria bacterium]|nr:hypothetical protein [Alphaproteobacteria bacterium]